VIPVQFGEDGKYRELIQDGKYRHRYNCTAQGMGL